MEEYYSKINKLAQDILMSARVDKKIDRSLFNEFYGLLNELRDIVTV